MKIKLILSLVFSILLIPLANSQNSKADTLRRAAGIDASFINNFLPLNNRIGSTGKYLLHYVRYKENDKMTRHALDVNAFGVFQNNEVDPNLNDARLDIDYKLSKGKRKRAFKNAYVLYGSEFSLGYFLNRRSVIDPNDMTSESLNKNFDQIFSLGFGPFVGLGYNLTKRLSIYTEASTSLILDYGIDNFESEFDPELNFKDKSTSVAVAYFLPSSIFLFYHF